MKEDVLTAKKIYNTNIRKWQYVTSDLRVLVTCKTEKVLEKSFDSFKSLFI